MRKVGVTIVLAALVTINLHAQLSNVFYVGQTMILNGMTSYVYDVDYNYAVQATFLHHDTKVIPGDTPMYIYLIVITYEHTQVAAYNEIRGGPIGRLLDAYSEGNSFEDSQKLGRITEAMEDVNATYSTRLVWRDVVEQMLTSGILSEPQYKVQGYEVRTNPFDRTVFWAGRIDSVYCFNISDAIFSSEELTGNISIRNREGYLVYDGPVSIPPTGNKTHP